MIDWISASTSGRNQTQYIAAVISGSRGKLNDRENQQIALRFSYQAQKDFRLIPGDRISIGFDDATKQICFKRTTDSGYKLGFSTALKPGEEPAPNAILVVCATTNRPAVKSVQYHRRDVVIESSHISINAPEFFGE